MNRQEFQAGLQQLGFLPFVHRYDENRRLDRTFLATLSDEDRAALLDVERFCSLGQGAFREFAALETCAGVIMLGLRNPDTNFPGPMLWLIFIPQADAAPVVVHRVLTGQPLAQLVNPLDIFEAKFTHAEGAESSYEEILQRLSERLAKGYAIENPLPSLLLMYRALFLIGVVHESQDDDS